MIAITRAESSDAKAIMELQKLAYQSEARLYNNFSIGPIVQTLDEIKGQFQTHTVLKAVINHEIIGSVRAYEKNGTCYSGKLIVHPDYQNRGIGKRLINE